jgi:DNA-binding transcriptional LysR family regulator
MLSANLRRFPDGRLRIGCLPSLGLSIMPRAIRDFRALYPAVTCEVETDHIDALLVSLHARRLDLAVTLFRGEHRGIRTQTLAEVDLVYLGPKRGKDIHLSEIQDTELVGLSRSDKMGKLVADNLEAAGRRYNPSIEVQTYFLACAFAAAGCGAAIVDELTARSMLREGLFLRRTQPRMTIELALLTHESHTGRGFYTNFIDILKSAVNAKRD